MNMQYAVIRFGFFLGILGTMALWERLLPRRRTRTARTGPRWLWNLGLSMIDTAVLRLTGLLLWSGLAAGAAWWAAGRGWGLFNQLAWPYWLEFGLTLLAFDFLIWLQHLVLHKWAPLWRLHRVHHTDLDVDASTALRFHPLEILLSMGLKIGAAVGLGAPPLAVLTFEILLNGLAMFNHTNGFLPVRLDRFLRLFVVTPDMHRVHHSIWNEETDSNFGFNFPWWDRLFGTYRAQPRDGHTTMTIGLAEFRDEKVLSLARLLLLPFASQEKAAPPRRR